MRRIAIINQKGGVGKTTTSVNLGAALARAGQRVVVIDLDAQANATMHLGIDLDPGEPSTYGILCGDLSIADALRPTSTRGLSLVPSHIDLSGAELELASAIGRETILRDALKAWEAAGGEADYVLFDCPPSLGLLSVNGLCAAQDVIVALQTEFFALQGLSKLIEIVQLLRSRLNPELQLAGVLPCLYDSRLRLGREILGEIRRYFGDQVLGPAIRTNVKLAEAPSHGQTIFEYDPTSTGARDYAALADELLRRHADERPPPTEEPGAVEVAALERRLTHMSRERRVKAAEEQAPDQQTPETKPIGAGFGAGVAAGHPPGDPGESLASSEPLESLSAEAVSAESLPDEARPIDERPDEALREVEIPRPDPEKSLVGSRLAEGADPEPVGGPYVHPIPLNESVACVDQQGKVTGAQLGTMIQATGDQLVGRALDSATAEPEEALGRAVEGETAVLGDEQNHGERGPLDAAPTTTKRALTGPLLGSTPVVGTGPAEETPAETPQAASEVRVEAFDSPQEAPDGVPESHLLDVNIDPSAGDTDPAPKGSLAPRGQNFYIGEDREHLASSRGPWVGRSLDDTQS